MVGRVAQVLRLGPVLVAPLRLDLVARLATFAINFPLAFAHLAMHFPRVRAGGKWRRRGTAQQGSCQ